MAETPAERNGFPWPKSGLPVAVLVVAVLVAVGSVSGLIFLLYQETRGPGEILREFAQSVDAGDCPASYRLLDPAVRSRVPEERWCEMLPEIDSRIDAGFDMQRAVLEGDVAVVHVSGIPDETWRLRRHGERSWRVLGPGDAGSFLGD